MITLVLKLGNVMRILPEVATSNFVCCGVNNDEDSGPQGLHHLCCCGTHAGNNLTIVQKRLALFFASKISRLIVDTLQKAKTSGGREAWIPPKVKEVTHHYI